MNLRLVFLHALPLDNRQWDALSSSFAVPAFSPRLYVYGDSLVDWARGVLDAVGRNDRLVVVGNSIGGSCALELARLAPDQIEALILVGAKAGHRPEPEFRDQFIAALEKNPTTTVQKWVDELLSPTCPVDVRDHVHAIAQSQPVNDLIRGVRAFHTRPDATEVAANWCRPLVWVRGEFDRTSTAFSEFRKPAAPAQSNQNKGGAAHSDTRTVPNCGHYPNLEQPQAFHEIVREVLAKVQGQ